MTKKYCDRCKEVIPDIVLIPIPNKKWKKQTSDPVPLPCSFEFNGQTFDFCGNCVRDFKRFLGEKNHMRR